MKNFEDVNILTEILPNFGCLKENLYSIVYR